MKKFFLSIFIWMFLFWISFWYTSYIWGKKWQEIQAQARKNLKFLENTSWICKKKVSYLINKCESIYWNLHWISCLNKMLSDGKAWPITLLVYYTELDCATNSMLNNKVLNREEVVKNFCYKMSSYKRVLNNLDFINAKNSVFLRILCNETWIYTSKQFAKNVKIRKNVKKYYKNLKKDAQKNSFINFWLFWKCKNTDGIVVNPGWLNNVNFVCVANDIWNKLAEDEINLWTYIAYWWFRKSWEKSFFLGDKWICPNWYLNNWSQDSTCTHPDTYKILKSTQWSLKSILSNLNLFPKLNWIDDIWKIIWWTWNLFLNLRDSVYNELYFYTYFLAYYWKMIQNHTSNLQLKKVGTTIKTVDLSTAKEFKQAQKSILIARLSLKKSFEILKNIYWTYPVHVWLLAIIEDFKALRQDLARIYTPLDQLRYKLENVQDLSKH